jgi:sulfur carrier protein
MNPSQQIQVIVNGAPRPLRADATLAQLLESMGIGSDAKGVAVAVGDSVVRKADWPATTLTDGARVEVVTAVQGG